MENVGSINLYMLLFGCIVNYFMQHQQTYVLISNIERSSSRYGWWVKRETKMVSIMEID